jgi:hypothetical protein
MDGRDAAPGDTPWWRWTGNPDSEGFLNHPEEAALMRLNMAARRRCRWCVAPMEWRGLGFVCSGNTEPEGCDG